MNKKGFTLVEVLAVIVIMSFLMMMIYPNIQKLQEQNNSKKYTAYEDMMVEYAITYGNNRNSIFLDELPGLEKTKNECEGYVHRENSNSPYKAYIKCGEKYTTQGYTT